MSDGKEIPIKIIINFNRKSQIVFGTLIQKTLIFVVREKIKNRFTGVRYKGFCHRILEVDKIDGVIVLNIENRHIIKYI